MSEESRVSVDTFPVEHWGEIFDARDAGRSGAFCFEDVYDVETPSAPPRTYLWIVVPSLQGALAEAARLGSSPHPATSILRALALWRAAPCGTPGRMSPASS